MTTPAGWYDDGSGRQRWWDGTQWTEHFAPLAAEAPAADTSGSDTTGTDVTGGDVTGTDVTGTDAGAVETAAAARDEAPHDAAAAETADAIGSVAAVESQSWNTPAPNDGADAGTASAADADSASADAGSAYASPAYGSDAGEPAATWPPTDTDTSDNAANNGVEAPSENAPQWPDQGFAAPGATAATTPLSDTGSPYGHPAPSYPGAGASYPGAAAPEQPQQYQSAPGYPQTTPGYTQTTPGYPGASAYAPPGQAYGAGGGYPAPYGSPAPVEPPRLSIVGVVGLAIAGLGTILSCIPATFVFGWILLAAGFIVSLISIFLKGKKWPGIAGLILSVVGTILAVVVAIVLVTSSVAQVVRDLPTAPPSSDSDTGTDEGTDPGTDGGTGPIDVVQGEIGSPLTITQMSGTSEVTVNSATWATDDGSSIPSTNGGYVILDVTFTGVSGTSYVNPFYFALTTAEGTEGTYDYYVDGIVAEELAEGDTVSGKITFDVAKSTAYRITFTDELLQDVASIAFTPSEG
ncbi:DUF2510 domain-containing protein [Microbacterium sp. ANT_H45B]|uniref:DUF2510 domain-containing protein n=1 Tax=Microbacterium sp. ANT_H45B TaxID=2597346 RepID=UPI0011EF875C|nr:DUF2510 domain-containing protein [Microbacterium sp. ANT_H45B]KAA0959401.1 DUF2510 domain-containing protein [Microbacterium sp. ANT_H45B]